MHLPEHKWRRWQRHKHTHTEYTQAIALNKNEKPMKRTNETNHIILLLYMLNVFLGSLFIPDSSWFSPWLHWKSYDEALVFLYMCVCMRIQCISLATYSSHFAFYYYIFVYCRFFFVPYSRFSNRLPHTIPFLYTQPHRIRDRERENEKTTEKKTHTHTPHLMQSHFRQDLWVYNNTAYRFPIFKMISHKNERSNTFLIYILSRCI